VAANKAQVYGSTVTFASGGVGYPAGCSTSSPWAMAADVEVFSGFPEQLRNVYARITSQSAGPTFCATATPGPIAPPAGSYSGLYFYQPLNNGTSPSLIKRSLQWSMNLPNNNPFWFSGDLWAEVIPGPLTLTTSSGSTNPADNAIIHTGGGGSSRQTFRWVNDPRADGSNSGENYAVARPTGGASLTVMQCGSSAQAFNSALCTTFIVNPRLFTLGSTSYSRRYNAGSWYQWSLRTSFLLPGSSTRVLGSTVLTRHFAVVNP